eukprot:6201757-Pleurochrysis_carterae.AAC.2
MGSEAFVFCFLTEARAATYPRLRSLASLAVSAYCDNSRQVQMLLLRHCANADLNHSLRTVTSSLTSVSALQHDSAVDRCLSDILACPAAPASDIIAAGQRAHLPIAMGGLGGVSAHDSRHAAYTASYMACLPRVRLLFPSLAGLDPEREPLPAMATMHASLARIRRQLSELQQCRASHTAVWTDSRCQLYMPFLRPLRP